MAKLSEKEQKYSEIEEESLQKDLKIEKIQAKNIKMKEQTLQI